MVTRNNDYCIYQSFETSVLYLKIGKFQNSYPATTIVIIIGAIWLWV